MARMIAEVYDALKSAGADDDKARAAAIALADTDRVMVDIRQRLRGCRMGRRCQHGDVGRLGLEAHRVR